MKKLIVVVSLFAAMFLPQLASADGVPVGDVTVYQGSYQSGSGGEFNFVPQTGSTLAGYITEYAAATHTSNSFQTFCLEHSEYISYGVTYSAKTNTNAVNGGVGPTGDPVSLGTAYLYYQFAEGVLKDYAYSGTVDQRKASADALQKAIWALEGETGGDTSSIYYVLAVSIFGAAVGDDANGAYGVYALNLYTSSGGLAQDALVYTGVPIPPSAWLLGSGLLGLLGVRRRMTA